MSTHRFAVGETVEFLPSARDSNIPRGRYKIERLLPTERFACQYRVKHTVDGHERVAAEAELTLIGKLFG